MTTSTKRRVNRAAAKRTNDAKRTLVSKIDETATDTAALIEAAAVVEPATDQPTNTAVDVVIPATMWVPNDAKEIGALFIHEDGKGKELDASRTARFVGMVLFALRHPENVEVWYEHYVSYDPPAGTTMDADARKRKTDAAEWFLDMFGIASAKGMAADERNDQNNLIKRFFRGVRFIVTLWHNEMLSSFGFNDAGGVFINRKSALGEHVMDVRTKQAVNPWNVDTLNKESVDKFPMVDRTTQAIGAKIAWTDLERMFTGDKASVGDKVTTVGNAPPVVKPLVISPNNPTEALMRAVDMRLASPPSGANAFNQCREMVLRGIALIELALSNSVMRPVTDETRAAFQAFAVGFNKNIGMTPAPIKNEEAAKDAA